MSRPTAASAVSSESRPQQVEDGSEPLCDYGIMDRYCAYGLIIWSKCRAVSYNGNVNSKRKIFVGNVDTVRLWSICFRWCGLPPRVDNATSHFRAHPVPYDVTPGETGLPQQSSCVVIGREPKHFSSFLPFVEDVVTNECPESFGSFVEANRRPLRAGELAAGLQCGDYLLQEMFLAPNDIGMSSDEVRELLGGFGDVEGLLPFLEGRDESLLFQVAEDEVRGRPRDAGALGDLLDGARAELEDREVHSGFLLGKTNPLQVALELVRHAPSRA